MRRICWGLLLAAMWPFGAMADEFDNGLATLWEVLWHQSGTPTRIVRWEGDIRVRLHGVNIAAHREHTLQALRAVTSEAGLKLIDVSGQPEEQTANLTVEITADNVVSLDTTDANTFGSFFKWVSASVSAGNKSMGTNKEAALPPPPPEVNVVI